jgi:hypothetical protein
MSVREESIGSLWQQFLFSQQKRPDDFFTSPDCATKFATVVTTNTRNHVIIMLSTNHGWSFEKETRLVGAQLFVAHGGSVLRERNMIDAQLLVVNGDQTFEKKHDRCPILGCTCWPVL